METAEELKRMNARFVCFTKGIIRTPHTVEITVYIPRTFGVYCVVPAYTVNVRMWPDEWVKFSRS